MSLTFLPTQLTVITSVCMVLLVGWLSWLGWRKSQFDRRVGMLELLRCLIVALVALTLNQPEWLVRYQPQRQPTLVVLADQSGSMQTRDVVATTSVAGVSRELPAEKNSDGGADQPEPAADGDTAPRDARPNSPRPNSPRPNSPRTNPSRTSPPHAGTPISRADWLAPLLQSAAELASDELDVIVEPFSSSLEPASSGTDIAAALEHALGNHAQLRGIVLASDGDWNVGDAPANAASQLRAGEVPVYSLVAGSETRLPDLVLERFDVPSYGVVSKPMRVPFVIRSSLARDVVAKVTLRTDAATPLEKQVIVPAMGQLDDSLVWTPTQVGDVTLTMSVPEQQEEFQRENNRREVPISIREEAIRVLIIESFPRWEYRYLRNALERDPGVEVNCLLLHPGLSKVGGGRGYIKTFPATLEALAQYDVVLLGDVGVGPGQLTVEQCRLLKGLVRSQASGLILMPGMRGGHLSWQDTELEELYPVVLDPAQPRGWGSREPAQFELTATGRRSLLTKLDDDEQANAKLWEMLPGFHWYAAALRSKAGTEVLATHKTEMGPQGRIPLLVTKTLGTGKILYMGTDAVWRWRRGVEDKYHYRFWGQVARWMAYQRSIAQGERMRLFYSPDRPLVDSVMTLNANVMSDSGEPLQDGHVTVQAIAPSGKSSTVTLRPSGDEWGLFTGTFSPTQPGQYRLVLSCRENSSTLETPLSVQGTQREQQGQPVRQDVMQELARITRGRMIRASELPELVQELRALPDPEPLVRRFRLWCHPAWAGCLVSLLGAFWWGRKLVGQV